MNIRAGDLETVASLLEEAADPEAATLVLFDMMVLV